MAEWRRIFEIRAGWDSEAGVGCSSDELPLSTQAPTFQQFVSHVFEIVPEIAGENGLAALSEEMEVHVTPERVQFRARGCRSVNARDLRS
jgi:hypothetical protein